MAMTRNFRHASIYTGVTRRWAVALHLHRLVSKRWNSSAQAPVKEDIRGLPSFDSSLLTIEESKLQQNKFVPDAPFGTSFTDHMLSIGWTALEGWQAPKIHPIEDLKLHPATSSLHYAFQCFEGTKAYKDKSGRLRLFRPHMNMQRLKRSAARLALPIFDESQAVDVLARFVACEERFVPRQRGQALYLRPTMISTEPTFAMGPPNSALFYVLASPVAALFATGQKAVSLEATTKYARAWPGGMGAMKVGGNYAPCFVPQIEAASRGFQQNLWLSEPRQALTEVGSMNLFVLMTDPTTGKDELVTPPIDGTILPGVTRDSVLVLARDRLQGLVQVSEREVTMLEVARASDEGRLKEVFGTGTAAVILPVRTIGWDARLVSCGLDEGQEIGPLASQMKEWIESIQYGDLDHEWSYVVSR